VYFKQIRIILRDFNWKLNRERLSITLGVGNPDQLFFSLTSGFLFNILTSCFPTDLFESLLSRSYFNERNEGRLVFFPDSSSRMSWSNITTVAHEVAQNGTSLGSIFQNLFSKIRSKYFVKEKIILSSNYPRPPPGNQAAWHVGGFFPLVGQPHRVGVGVESGRECETRCFSSKVVAFKLKSPAFHTQTLWSLMSTSVKIL